MWKKSKELRFCRLNSACAAYQPSASSIASMTLGASGSTVGPNLATTVPSRPTRNFSKFHFTTPGSRPVRNLVSSEYSRCWFRPRTSALAVSGNVTPKLRSQNSAISLSVPGSWPANWVDGTGAGSTVVGAGTGATVVGTGAGSTVVGTGAGSTVVGAGAGATVVGTG